MSTPAPGPFARLGRSLRASFGTVVFGMSDGPVSIFGLVFGVATSATSSAQVLLAGATGAVAAGVSDTAIEVLREDLLAEPRRTGAIAFVHALHARPPRGQVVFDAIWMFIASLGAGLAPALPFLWLAIEQARIVTVT